MEKRKNPKKCRSARTTAESLDRALDLRSSNSLDERVMPISVSLPLTACSAHLCLVYFPLHLTAYPCVCLCFFPIFSPILVHGIRHGGSQCPRIVPVLLDTVTYRWRPYSRPAQWDHHCMTCTMIGQICSRWHRWGDFNSIELLSSATADPRCNCITVTRQTVGRANSGAQKPNDTELV